MYMLNPQDITSNVALKSGYTYTNNIVKDTNNYIVYQNGCKPSAVSTTTTSYNCRTSPWSLNATALTQVADTTYYLGGLGYTIEEVSDDLSADMLSKTTMDFYTFERGTAKYNDSRSLSWTGKVGLMYASDYAYTFAYGVDNSCFNSPIGCGDISGTPTTSWLFNSNYYQLTINSFFIYSAPDGSGIVFYVHGEGGVNYGVASYDVDEVRPVVYLRTDIQIEGEGTNDENIYRIVN